MKISDQIGLAVTNLSRQMCIRDRPLLPQPSSPNNPNRKFCPLIQEYLSLIHI